MSNQEESWLVLAVVGSNQNRGNGSLPPPSLLRKHISRFRPGIYFMNVFAPFFGPGLIMRARSGQGRGRERAGRVRAGSGQVQDRVWAGSGGRVGQKICFLVRGCPGL